MPFTEKYQTILLNVRNRLSLHDRNSASIRILLGEAAFALGFESSVLLSQSGPRSMTAMVTADETKSDSSSFLALSSKDDPEMWALIHRVTSLCVANVETDPNTQAMKGALKDHGVGSLAVFPLLWHGELLGSLFFYNAHCMGIGVNQAGRDFGGLFSMQLTTIVLEELTSPLSRRSSLSLGIYGQVEQLSDASGVRNQLELDLQHSNDFLANMIDSVVDAIIAVDMRGCVIIFNKGAEILFGYDSAQVVNKMSVAKLYPKNTPSKVMKMLRSVKYGGVGRLEQVRREVLVRDGELVPVHMTASIVYKEGREVATVGIFYDLRDRIRIEQRLLHVQEELKSQEQRSLLAQLAGAAAHELNQPLTSIIGYAQLIERKVELKEEQLRYTSTIVKEAERMAAIVKKIGRITKFETVPYVGSANIVDLDRSVEASESVAVPVLVLDDVLTARIDRNKKK